MIAVLIIAIVLFVLILLTGHPYRIINKYKSDNYYYNLYKTQIRYVPMGNWFELGNQKLDGIDLKTAVVLGSKHIKDKDAVYFQDTKIINADPDSFVVVDNLYAKDKNTVYYCSHSFCDIDVNTFEFVKDEYIVLKDKNHIYSICFGDYGVYSTKNTVIPFLPEGIVFMNTRYSKDNEWVYYKGQIIKGADTKTFVLLYYEYAKDDYNVYHNGLLLEGADSKTFVCIGDYAKDSNKVYSSGIELKGVDVNSFKGIDKSRYMKDANGVYYGIQVFYNSEGLPTHFTAIKIAGADPQTFELMNNPTHRMDAKDKYRKYLRGEAK